MSFQRAERKKAKARIGLCGPAGSGKTMSALKLAFGLGGKVAIIDTEHGSAELYSDLGEYDVATIKPPYEVQKYLALIKQAEEAGYDVLILDSLSHAWSGEGGLLDMQGKIADSGKGNSYTAWRQVTPWHNRLIDAILASPCHVIATMRSKTEYVLETNSNGKQVPRKVGMAPVQREGMDYEFTLVFEVSQANHSAATSKDRTDLFNGFCEVLSEEHGKKIADWLEGGAEDKTAIHKANGAAIKGELEGAFTAEDVDGILANRKQWIDDMPRPWQDKLNAIATAKRQELTPAAVNQ
jgi:hypothetical protein